MQNALRVFSLQQVRFRDHNDTELHSTLAGSIRTLQILNKMGRASGFKMTGDMHRQLHRTKIFGLKGGENCLFKVARWQVQRGIGRGLPAMIFPDLLHTFLKGMIECVCGWTLQIIRRISKLDENFRTAMGKVEKSMVSMLPTLQAFFPVRPYAFHDGVFELIKDKALEADKPVSSFMLGKW